MRGTPQREAKREASRDQYLTFVTLAIVVLV